MPISMTGSISWRSARSWGAGEIPILYFTQLVALAFGLGDKAAALTKIMVDLRPQLARIWGLALSAGRRLEYE